MTVTRYVAALATVMIELTASSLAAVEMFMRRHFITTADMTSISALTFRQRRRDEPDMSGEAGDDGAPMSCAAQAPIISMRPSRRGNRRYRRDDECASMPPIPKALEAFDEANIEATSIE